MTDWLQQTYPSIRTVADFDERELVDPGCRELFGWWKGYQPVLPPRSDFDIVEHPALAANIYLIEQVSSSEFRIRLQGERVRQMVGPSGFPTTLKTNDTGPIGQIARNYAEAIARNAALRHAGSFDPFDKEYLQIEAVEVPLAADIGNTGYILGVIYPVSQGG